MGREARVRRRAAGMILFSTVLVLPLLVPGCAGRGGREGEEGGGVGLEPAREVAVSTLAQGVYSEYGRLEGVPAAENAVPECLVITDADELQRLVSLALFQEPVEEVDFSRSVVLAAMLGPRDTGGFAVSITRVCQEGSAVRVELELVEPEPGSMNAQVLTSPYHLVVAEREAFQPRGLLLFTFVDRNDDILAEQRADI